MSRNHFFCDRSIERVATSLNERGQGIYFEPGYGPIYANDWLPGERALLKIVDERSTYAYAHLRHRINDHPQRQSPPCPLFTCCGGCQLQHLNDDAQRAWKIEYLQGLLQKEGLDIGLEPMVYLENHGYRHKLLLPFQRKQGRVEAGFFKPGTHEITPLVSCVGEQIVATSCFVQTPELNALVETTVKILSEMQVEMVDETGNLEAARAIFRYLFARQSYGNSSVHITFGVTALDDVWAVIAKKICVALSGFVNVVGAFVIVQPRLDNRLLIGEHHHIFGEHQLQERILGLEFAIDPISFFQVNPKMAELIWKQMGSWLKDRGIVSILELYCGSGVLSTWLAQQGFRVLGLERDKNAVESAKRLASRYIGENGHAEFLEYDLETGILNFEAIWEAVIVNPPRKGLGESTLQFLHQHPVSTLIYMACGVKALARDLKKLQTMGFFVEVICPYELFPQTSHFETLVLLKR